MWYPCNECYYTANTRRSLKVHIEIKHEGVRYPCNQCEYVATRPYHLTGHIRVKHEGLRFQCDQCDYTSATSTDIKRHGER